jgi:hypothetical protein
MIYLFKREKNSLTYKICMSKYLLLSDLYIKKC